MAWWWLCVWRAGETGWQKSDLDCLDPRTKNIWLTSMPGSLLVQRLRRWTSNDPALKQASPCFWEWPGDPDTALITVSAATEMTSLQHRRQHLLHVSVLPLCVARRWKKHGNIYCRRIQLLISCKFWKMYSFIFLSKFAQKMHSNITTQKDGTFSWKYVFVSFLCSNYF